MGLGQSFAQNPGNEKQDYDQHNPGDQQNEGERFFGTLYFGDIELNVDAVSTMWRDHDVIGLISKLDVVSNPIGQIPADSPESAALTCLLAR